MRASAFDLEAADPKALRPGIPLLLPAALAMWATAAASYTWLDGVADNVSIWLAAGGVALAVATLAFALSERMRSVAVVVAFAFLGIAVGSAGAWSYEVACANFPSGNREWSFELENDPSKSDFGSNADAVASDGNGHTVRVRVYFNEDSRLYTGARFRASCALKSLKLTQRASCRTSGIVASASVSTFETLPLDPARQLVYDMRANAIGLMAEHAGDNAGVMQALVCGYRNTIRDGSEYDLFKQCGLAHIVAVSGAHLAIVVMTFGALLKLARMPRKATLAITFVFVLAYLAFSGIPISAIRAAIMVVASMTAGLAARRNAPINSLAICIIIFLALDATSAVSVSLFLSAGSTLGILLFAKLFTSWLAGVPQVIVDSVGEPLALTLSSNVATLPFSVAMFSQLPLVAPVANVVATPLFTMGCVCGLVCAVVSCAFAPIAPVLMAIGGLACAPLRLAVSLMSSVPYSCIALAAPVLPMILLSAVAMALLWWKWPKPDRRSLGRVGAVLIAVSVVFACTQLLPKESEIVALDVGQGDSILIRSGTSSMLVDTGNSDSKLRSALAERGVVHLDAVLITHPDSDHAESLSSLFGYVQVDRFLCAQGLIESDESKCRALMETARDGVGSGIYGVSKGDVLSVGDFALEVVWPESFKDGGNADSVCLLAKADVDRDGASDWSVLLTGDAEKEQLKSMVSKGSVGDIDVLKVGHHGSKVALDDDVAAKLSPEVALISVGAYNRYGHPSREVLECLDRAGAKVLRTDECGSIRLAFSKGGLKVE